MDENKRPIDDAEHESREWTIAICISAMIHVIVIVLVLFFSQSFSRNEDLQSKSMDVDLTAYEPPAAHQEEKMNEPVQEKTPEKIENKDVTEIPNPAEPKTIVPKTIEPLKIPTQRIEPKAIEPSRIMPKIPANKLAVPTQTPVNPIASREIQPRELPIPAKINPSVKPKNFSDNFGTPKSNHIVGPQPTEFKDIKRNAVAAPEPNSRPMPPSSRFSPASANSLPTGLAPRSAGIPLAKNDPLPAPVEKKPKAPAPPPPPRPMVQTKSKEPEEAMVIINSSVLGTSDRVKNLKRDIQRKAMKLDPDNGPYQYTVKGFTCTLSFEGSGHNKVVIDFSPPDAPFEVVSALERIIR